MLYKKKGHEQKKYLLKLPLETNFFTFALQKLDITLI